MTTVAQSGRLSTSSKAVQYEGDLASGTRFLVVQVASRTNVSMSFRQPLEVEIGGRPQVINGVRLWADDPAGFAAAAQAHQDAGRH